MGSRGPAPDSKRKLEERGDYRAGGRRDDLELPEGVPEMPEGLDGYAAKEWRYMVEQLEGTGALSLLDRGSMFVLCLSYGEFLELTEDLLDVGAYPKGSNERRRVETARNDAYSKWYQLSTKFGLNPADRPRVKLMSKNTKGKNDGDTAEARALRLVGG